MYTRIEDAANHASEQRATEHGKKNIVGELRQLLTRVLGREFMELPFRHKICGLYLCLSFMAILVWDESRIWPNLLNLLNFVNAVRLANKAAKESSAQRLG